MDTNMTPINDSDHTHQNKQQMNFMNEVEDEDNHDYFNKPPPPPPQHQQMMHQFQNQQQIYPLHDHDKKLKISVSDDNSPKSYKSNINSSINIYANTNNKTNAAEKAIHPTILRNMLQNRLDIIHTIYLQKANVKKKIKIWIDAFEIQYSRQPSSNEKRDAIGNYYNEYKNLSKKFNKKIQVLETALEESGLSTDDVISWYTDTDTATATGIGADIGTGTGT